MVVKGLIRDKLLFGMDDTKLRDKLMRESDEKLSLDFVIKAIRVQEAGIKLKVVNSKTEKTENNTEEVGAVISGERQRRYSKSSQNMENRSCDRFGKNHHRQVRCPAFGTKCTNYGKMNHWAAKCRESKKKVDEVREELDGDEIYLGEITPIESIKSKSWFAKLKVHTKKLKGQTVNFKLDTGAALSVCGPNHCTGEIVPTTKKLIGPGNIPLECLGKISCHIRSQSGVMEEDLYVIPNQRTPLLSRKACETLKLIKVDTNQCQINAVNVDEKLFQGLGKLRVEHSIKLQEDARPFAITVPRPIPFPRRKMADEALSEMIENGVIVKVEEPTPWVAPMVVVPKPGQKKVRICTDYSELNKHILREIHPMATVESSLATLGQGVIFSKIDANSGFWQIPLSEESSKLTTFLTHSGRYRYRRLPQGLCSAPEIFQAEMSRILEGVDGVVIHMDDVLVHGEDQERHDRRLQTVLDRLQAAGMTLNKAKCRFGADRVEFLGHVIDHSGIHIGPRVKGVMDFPRPKNVKAVRSFLGMANQYAKFSEKLAEVSQPMRDLLRKNTPWYWSDKQEESFKRIKDLFRDAPVLAVYDVNKETIVTTDASNVGLGAILSQIQADGTRKLVAAASRSLTETEQTYAAIEKESLGICWAMEGFSQYILGMKNVMVETDHRPLVSLFGDMSLDRLPPRIQGFKLRLQRFQYKIRHVNGSQNVSADALSRNTSEKPTEDDNTRVNEIRLYVEEIVKPNGSDTRLEQLRTEQQADSTLSRVIRFVESEWPTYLSSVDTILRPYFERRSFLTMNKGFLMLGNRLVDPDVTERAGTSRSSSWSPRSQQMSVSSENQCMVADIV